MLAMLVSLTTEPEKASHTTEILVIATNLIVSGTTIALAYITYLVVKVEKTKTS